MNHRRNFGALGAHALVLALLLAGCSDSGEDDPSTGGAGPTGGVGAAGPTGGVGAMPGTGGVGGGTEPSCDAVVACGGDVVGAWTVSGACLSVSGDLDVAGFGLGCTTATVTGTLQVSGTWTANADGTYTDDLTWGGTEDIQLPASCLNVSGTVTTCDRLGGPLGGVGYAQGLAYTTVTCVSNPTTGGCTCTAPVEQVQSAASGTYTVAGNRVTTSGGLEFSYCVAGNTLTMTPEKWASTTSTSTTGTAVLQK